MIEIKYNSVSLIRSALIGSEPPRDFKAQRLLADLPPHMRPRRPWKSAAVLVPVVMHLKGLTILLTQRTESLLDHAGQVSFPGGSCEVDDSDPVQTALRETDEETGLDRRFIEAIGFLDGYLTITGYAVTPVVGLVKPGYRLQPDPLEVAEVFEVPLVFLRDPANRQIRSRRVGDRDVGYYLFEYNQHIIWGATAGMLVNFLHKLEQAEVA
ncbi:MAG TPA: CoA pyrophosphatase [Gammaproteobacteria bacterium]|nr:CoA pyrophosphatase [Gammaproteobacteria bacterium]HVC28412.1 CoA pyrophosphatase [Gammaproteobacteria bacterium]